MRRRVVQERRHDDPRMQRRPMRLYTCGECGKYTYSLVRHVCGKRMS